MEVLIRSVGGGILWVYHLEKWYSNTTAEADGGPRVAAVAELYGHEELFGAMWFLPAVCSGPCHSGNPADQPDV